MHTKIIAASFSLVHLALGLPGLGRRQTEDCETVHVFLARGSGEDYPGRQIDVVTAICDGIDSCGYEDIQYPATLFPDYCGSEGLGVVHGTSQIEDYASNCPDAQLVLSGYSQVRKKSPVAVPLRRAYPLTDVYLKGAQVIGNILGGQSGGTTGCTSQNTTGWGPSESPAPQSKRLRG